MASSNASDLDQEHKDLTSLREEEGRRFAEKHAKFTKEHNEMIQRYRETPLNLEDAGLRPHEPHLQVSITGPPTVSLSSQTFTFSARLTYLPTSQSSTQPLTLQTSSVYETDWTSGEAYLFYDSQGRVPDHEFLEISPDEEPVLVRPENGFVTLEPGESVEHEVEISLYWWWRDALQLGREYDVRMPWAHVAWWDYGTMERFHDTQVCFRETRDDGGFKIPASNVLRVKVVE